MDKITVRKPQMSEADVLTKLILRSKAHWGYSKEFMKSVERELTVTESYLENAVAFIAESENQIVGVVGLSIERDEIEFLFVDPVYIGKGVGNILWDKIVSEGKSIGIRSFKILSDPDAQPFYEKMGAKQIGMARSSVRMLPLLQFTFD